jgi:HK97 family phage major capsid protein
MKTLQELKVERASLKEKQQALVDKARNENRQMSDDENTQFDEHQDEIVRLDAEIKRAEIIEENERAASVSNGKPVGGAPAIVKRDEKDTPFSFIRAINNARNHKEHEGEEARCFEEGVSEFKERGLSFDNNASVAIPSSMLVRDISVDGDAGAKGGKLVASNPQVVMPLLPSLKLQEMGATVMTGLVGDYPLISGDEFSFSYLAENADAAPTDVNYDGPVLKPKRLGGVVDISNKWLAQTTPAAEANVKYLIGRGIEAAMTKAAISGATDGPTGLYDLITTNIQAGVAGNPTWADVVNLKTLIKSTNATKKNLYYLSDPALKGFLETAKKDAGSGIYICENDRLNGYNYTDSTLVGTLDAGSSHPLIFGDFAQMYVGFWTGVSFQIDPYTQASKGKTRLVFNLYNDVNVANEKAFAIRKNFTVS